jgi:WD40 repeat protein
MSKLQRIGLFALAPVLLAGLTLWTSPAGEKKTDSFVTLKGHKEEVYSVAFTPDGKFLATGSFDNTIKLWDVARAKEIRTFGGAAGHKDMVLSVAISPNGQLLASGSGGRGADNSLKIWDIPSDNPLRTFADKDAINAVALNPDGKFLATAGKDGSVKIWSAGDFKQLYNLTGHTGPVTGVAFSANGQVLASSGADRTIRFWNPIKGQPIAFVGAHGGSVNALAIHPNNTTAYSVGEDGLLKFWQIPPAPRRTIVTHGGAIQALALAGDGNQVLTGGADKTVRLSTLANAKEVRTYAGPAAAVESVAFNSNATLVAAGTADSRLFLWNAPDPKPVSQAYAHGGPVTGVAFHPQNTQLLTAGGDGLLKLWAMPPIPGRLLTHPDAVLSSAMTADGKRLFTGSADKVLRSWDMVKNIVERQFTGNGAAVTAVAISGNGQILVSGGDDATIRFWNQATGKENSSLGAHAGTVTSLALNPAGTQMVSSSTDGTVKLWQLPALPPRPFVHPDQVTSLALSPDGSKLLTGCSDKLARLWNFKTGAKERDFPGHTLALTCVAFSVNGQLAAAGSADKSLTIWNVADAKVKKKIPVPGVVKAVAFHPDGKSLAAGLADDTIRMFVIADGKESKNWKAHKGGVSGLAFTPKGDKLLSSGGDKDLQIWNAATGGGEKKLEHVASVTSLALSKDGTRVAGAAEKTIKVWNVADGKEVLSITTPAEIKGLAISSDGKMLLAAGSDKSARLYDFNGKLVQFFPHDGPVQAVAFAGPRELVTAGADKLARAWASPPLWQKSLSGPVRRAIFSPKGDQVIAADGKTIFFWSAADGKELKNLPAHPEAILAFDLNADGTRLATTAADKSVKVWNLADLKKPAAVIPLNAPAQTIAFSPNGLRVAVALEEQKATLLRVFDASSGRELQVIPDHQGAIRSLAFLGDNRTLISSSQDKTTRLSNVSVLAALDAHPGGVSGVQFHSNGTQALSAGADKTVKLWDLTKRTVIKTFGPLTDPVKAVVFSRDFTQIGAAAGKTVAVWNLADGKQLYTLNHPTEVLSLSFNQDKTRIATGAADKLTRIWELASGKELQFFPQEESVAAVVFDGKGTGVISAGGKSAHVDNLSIIRVISASTGPLYALGITATGTHVLTGGADKSVKLWNTANGANERTFTGAADTVRAITVAKNNVLVAIGGADKTVRVHNFADAKELGSVKAAGIITALSFSPNSLALAGSLTDKTVLTWDTTFAQPLPASFLSPIQAFTLGDAVTAVVFAADNATIYSSSLDKKVQAWKLASPAPVRNFPHPNLVDAVAFNKDGTQVASGCHDGKIRIYDLIKGVLFKEINAHPTANATQIYCVAYSPDGTKIVSAGFDNSLKLWDAKSGTLVKEFKAYKAKDFAKGHQDSVFAAAFSPDGKFLASGSAGLERVIKIWNVADGTVVRDLANPQLKANPVRSHPGWIYNLRFTKDGKYLVSVGDAPMNKGYLAVWDWKEGKMLYGEAHPLGSFFGLAIAPNGKLAIGAGPRGRNEDLNSAYLMNLPVKEKEKEKEE